MVPTDLESARAALLQKLDAELNLFRVKVAEWAGDGRVPGDIRADMRVLLEPTKDGPYVYCAIHGTAQRAHPYYHDKGIHCHLCAEQSEIDRDAVRRTLERCEKAINEAVSGIRKPDIMEWIEIITQAQAVLGVNNNGRSD